MACSGLGVGVKVGVGEGVAVAVGLGGTVGVAEAAGGRDVGVTLIVGAGCELQALKRMRDRVMERPRDFMRAIMTETCACVKHAPLFDMPVPVCYTGAKL
jgi:hypothetical protein